ncbi:MAG TPA: hypothetical protein VFV49_05985 [Thermoanaerobaculia bacterium]|nr:hypothetical protein [Thermoanaerobaculia bacterium]
MAQPVTPTAAPIPPARRSTWWIVPAVIVGLVLVAWLVLAGLPFGGEKRVVATATTETIAEGTVTARPIETGTVVEVGGDDDFATETAPPPPLATATQTAPITQTQPVIVEEPRETQQPRTREPGAIPASPRPIPPPQPVEDRSDPPAPREEPPAEITESEASSILRGHLAGSNPYDGVSGRCLQLRSAGYRNVGYTFSVWDACVEGGGSRMLGRWRVDAKTREVFRQRDDGRYLRP